MATTTRPRATARDRDGRRGVGRVLAGAALILGIVVLYANGARYADTNGAVPAIATGQTAPHLVPASLGALDRAWVITGDEAARQIASLHVGAVRVQDAEIAGYGPDTTVWVATTRGAASARAMRAAMVRAIDRGDTPFTAPTRVAGLPGAYQTTGDGQTHVFFAAGDAVWWLASTPGSALDLARALSTEAAR
jgi:hypothetical protein